MELDFIVEEGQITLLQIRCITASKDVIKQLPRRTGLFPEELATLKPIAWFNGEAAFGHDYAGIRMGLAMLENQIIVLNFGKHGWGYDLIQSFMDKEQIIIV